MTNQEKTSLLHATNISRSFPATEEGGEPLSVLNSVSLSVARGEIVAIVGASGTGKSTLLHILGCLDTPNSGTIAIETREGKKIELSSRSPKDLTALRNKLFGYVFQFHHLLPEFSALENVAMPALLANKSTKVAYSRAEQMLLYVGLDKRVHHKPGQLSGGEQQRVAFARALMNSPEIILADEPTGNLDAANSTRLIELILRERRESQQTFIIVTHSSEVAAAADRVLTMSNGAIVQHI